MRADPETWVNAAYARFETDGLAGIRIEAIARDLGATKGSFYWHFADRKALVDAVMHRWESEETERYIDGAELSDDPRVRIATLFDLVGRRRARGEDRLYLEAEPEGVADVVERVTGRRVRYIADALVRAGVEEAEAHNRALVALASTLGLAQLTRGGATSVVPHPASGLSDSLLAYMFS